MGTKEGKVQRISLKRDASSEQTNTINTDINMFRSKLQTRHLMEQREATDWPALYLVYEEWAWRDMMLAKQYLPYAKKRENDQWNTTTAIIDFVQEDDVLDLIVGGIDGKVYLLHNIQAYEHTGEFQVAGIIGRSFSSKYKQITGTYSMVADVVQNKPIHVAGKYANQRWINHELTLVNNHQSATEENRL